MPEAQLEAPSRNTWAEWSSGTKAGHTQAFSGGGERALCSQPKGSALAPEGDLQGPCVVWAALVHGCLTMCTRNSEPQGQAVQHSVPRATSLGDSWTLGSGRRSSTWVPKKVSQAPASGSSESKHHAGWPRGGRFIHSLSFTHLQFTHTFITRLIHSVTPWFARRPPIGSLTHPFAHASTHSPITPSPGRSRARPPAASARPPPSQLCSPPQTYPLPPTASTRHCFDGRLQCQLRAACHNLVASDFYA